jgi:hypothetical protein
MELLAVALVSLWCALALAVGLLIGRMIHLRDAVRPSSSASRPGHALRLVG